MLPSGVINDDDDERWLLKRRPWS